MLALGVLMTRLLVDDEAVDVGVDFWLANTSVDAIGSGTVLVGAAEAYDASATSAFSCDWNAGSVAVAITGVCSSGVASGGIGSSFC